MKNFDDRSLDEKIKIIIEETAWVDSRPWNRSLKAKFFVSAPFLLFTIGAISIKYKDGFWAVLSIIGIPFLILLLAICFVSLRK